MLNSDQSKVARTLIRWLIKQGLEQTEARRELVSLFNKYELRDIKASMTRVTSIAQMKTFLNHRVYKRSTLPKLPHNGVQTA